MELNKINETISDLEIMVELNKTNETIFDLEAREQQKTLSHVTI